MTEPKIDVGKALYSSGSIRFPPLALAAHNFVSGVNLSHWHVTILRETTLRLGYNASPQPETKTRPLGDSGWVGNNLLAG